MLSKSGVFIWGYCKREMTLNNAGKMINQTWDEIPVYYNGFNIHQFNVMPSHIHGIIEIVGATPCGRPESWQPQQNGQSFDGKLWQRNYWEHIIRNDNEYNRISQYIIDNPSKWENDKLNAGSGNVVMEIQPEYNSEIWMV